MSSRLSGCKDFFFKYWIEKAPKQSINQSIDQRPLLDIEKKTIYLGWLCVSYALSEFIARCFKTFVSPIFCWNCGREVSGKFHKGVKSHLGWYKLNQSINQKINTIGTGPMIGSGSDRASLSSGMLPPIVSMWSADGQHVVTISRSWLYPSIRLWIVVTFSDAADKSQT